MDNNQDSIALTPELIKLRMEDNIINNLTNNRTSSYHNRSRVLAGYNKIMNFVKRSSK